MATPRLLIRIAPDTTAAHRGPGAEITGHFSFHAAGAQIIP